MDNTQMIVGILAAIATLVVISAISRPTTTKMILNKPMRDFTKRDKIRYWGVFMGIVAVSISFLFAVGYTFGTGAYFSFLGTLSVLCAVSFLYLTIVVFMPVGPEKKDEVYGEYPGESATVSVRLSKNTLDLFYNVFADGKKVAKIYRGRELKVPMPAGQCELSVSKRKPVRATGGTYDIYDGMALFIGSDLKNKLPIWIMTLPGDEAALEEATRRSRRRGKIMFGIMAVCFVWLSVFYWASIFFLPDLMAW